MKTLIAIVVLVVLGGVGFMLWKPAESPRTAEENSEEAKASDSTVVTDGAYTVVASSSVVNWSAKKPLIDGYVNSGTIEVEKGMISVAGAMATGTFTVDMNTIHVGITAKKPGQEGTLEGHLKSARWFEVEKFPTATFAITSVAPRADSATTFIYDVTGNLTLKGQTHALSFPATIYLDTAGLLHAKSSFEFDRTKWGVTSGSSNFFENLAENAISDMVSMSFDIVAAKQ